MTLFWGGFRGGPELISTPFIHGEEVGVVEAWQQIGLDWTLRLSTGRDSADSTSWASLGPLLCAARCCTFYHSVQFSFQPSVGAAALEPVTQRSPGASRVVAKLLKMMDCTLHPLLKLLVDNKVSSFGDSFRSTVNRTATGSHSFRLQLNIQWLPTGLGKESFFWFTVTVHILHSLSSLFYVNRCSCSFRDGQSICLSVCLSVFNAELKMGKFCGHRCNGKRGCLVTLC